jgi:hypothetical protein
MVSRDVVLGLGLGRGAPVQTFGLAHGMLRLDHAVSDRLNQERRAAETYLDRRGIRRFLGVLHSDGGQRLS